MKRAAKTAMLSMKVHDASVDAAVLERERLRCWEALMRRERHHFAAGEMESAMAVQVEALDLACELLDALRQSRQGVATDEVLAAWVVSHHNVADLLALRGGHDEAIDKLCAAHAGLLQVWRDEVLSPEWRNAALRHMRETRAELLLWQAKFQTDERITAALCEPPENLDTTRYVPGFH